MDEIVPVDKFPATPFRQEIELHQVTHDAGFVTLRLRIREGKRFTIFDIDKETATVWGNALLNWVNSQKEGASK